MEGQNKGYRLIYCKSDAQLINYAVRPGKKYRNSRTNTRESLLVVLKSFSIIHLCSSGIKLQFPFRDLSEEVRQVLLLHECADDKLKPGGIMASSQWHCQDGRATSSSAE